VDFCCDFLPCVVGKCIFFRMAATISSSTASCNIAHTYLSAHLGIYLSICLSVCLCVCSSVCLSVYLPIYASVSVSTYSVVYLRTQLASCLATCLFICHPLMALLFLQGPAWGERVVVVAVCLSMWWQWKSQKGVLISCTQLSVRSSRCLI
jgi:hypothetical protein